jgi:probable rRNA maturation factor
MILDFTSEDPRWRDLALQDRAEKAFQATLAQLNIANDSCEISLLACDDARIASLNANFRAKDQATNVLSWPATDLSAEAAGGAPQPPQPDFAGDMALGDIAIAFDTCQREAQAANRKMSDHVTHLLVHGLLHLLGYDHIRDLDATLMMEKEVEILGKLGVSDPYS